MSPQDTNKISVGDHVRVIDGKYKGRTGIVDNIIINRKEYNNIAVVYFDDMGNGMTDVNNLEVLED